MRLFLNFSSIAWTVTCELAPWLLLGATLSGFVHFFLPQKFIQRYLNGRTGILRAVLFGIPLPLCSCGVVPAGIGLKKMGAGNGASVGFLIATPQTGVDSVIASGGILGWPFAFFKVVVALITGMIGGYLSDWVSPRDSNEPANRSPATSKVSIQSAIRHSVEIIQSIWRWLLVGILVSALISQFMSGTIHQISDAGILAATLFALVVSLPLYVCATASIPIAAQLIASGMPVGAALVFLMAGPATNAATIGAIRAEFGWKIVGVYLGTIVVCSVGAAVVFDAFFESMTANSAQIHTHHTWWHTLSGVILLCLLVRFAWLDLSRSLVRRPALTDSGWRVTVSGMNCQSCVQSLTRSLESVAGVDAVQVTMAPDEAIVSGTASKMDICNAVRDAGFDPTHAESLS